MITNNFEIFIFTLTAATAGLGLFLVGRILLNFLKLQETRLQRKRHLSGVPAERRRTNNVPTITCSLPMQAQKRARQKLW